ncbi:piggyBac transposable element-derived protein 4-like [Saccostrea cucullata]|uniref:piggyBac transposable element-derived protein 4-like n=1 Tax=Saccostrea cuccullata TaxID=36930 RepID=UPI002ED65EC9
MAEMKVFLSLVICMGLVQKNDVHDYWATDDVQDTPFFREQMSRDRFLLILSNFHVTDNELQVPRGQVGFDPLFKVRPFVNQVLDAFSDVYSPDKDLSFDEATCAWKGRLRFRVYNPAKPTKFGIKLYQVCEAKSGYCIGFDIYTGSTPCTQYADAIGVDEDYTMTTRTVMGLLTRCGLLDRGHHVYMDNYYTSPELFEELRLHNTYACGTLRKNRRGVPEAIKRNVRLKQSQVIFRKKETTEMLAVKYHDKRDVHMLTTIHEANMSVLNKRDRTTNEYIAKPTCIVEYISQMGGVDLSDQISQYDTCLRKTTKWYKKLFFHLFNLCVVNAYLLYRKFNNDEKKLDSHGFKMAIATALIDEAPDVPKPNTSKGRKHTGDKAARLTERHFPDHIPAKPGAKRAKPCRDCYACNPKKSNRQGFKMKQTTFWCPDCKKPLCVPDCFRTYFSTALPSCIVTWGR